MALAIIGAITAVFAAIPVIIRLFQKSELSKQQGAEQDVQDIVDKIRDDGRPPS